MSNIRDRAIALVNESVPTDPGDWLRVMVEFAQNELRECTEVFGMNRDSDYSEIVEKIRERLK